jgi:hypothetical protein
MANKMYLGKKLVFDIFSIENLRKNGYFVSNCSTTVGKKK